MADRSETDSRPRTSADSFRAQARYVRLTAGDLETADPFGISEFELFDGSDTPRDETYGPCTTYDPRP